MSLVRRMNNLLIFFLFIPLIITVASAFTYISWKVRENAVSRLRTDIGVAAIFYQNAVREIRNTADRYARKKTVVFFFNLSLGEKLGRDLAVAARADRVDMVTLADTEYNVRARSHAPGRTDDILPRKQHIASAFSGELVAGTEILTREELTEEGFDTEKLSGPWKNVLVIIAIAPVYDRNLKNIMGAVIVRRILNSRPGIVKKVGSYLKVSAALFGDAGQIICGVADGPDTKIPESVLKQIFVFGFRCLMFDV